MKGLKRLLPAVQQDYSWASFRQVVTFAQAGVVNKILCSATDGSG
jgi:hypothetical protein